MILRNDLDELAATGQSSMPNGMEKELKHQDLAGFLLLCRDTRPACEEICGQ